MDAGLNKNAGVFIKNFYQPILRPQAPERELLRAGKAQEAVRACRLGLWALHVGLRGNRDRAIEALERLLRLAHDQRRAGHRFHATGDGEVDLAYNRWLTQMGYSGENPWHTWANSVSGDNGEILSGWSMRNARRPARVKEEHSETAYMTDRAIEFMSRHAAAAADQPWCLHLSYIKPHWPYIAPAPYNDMYGPEHVIAPVRSEAERADPHPVYREFMNHRVSKSFARDEVRDNVIPVYMGLIKQIDDQMGVLFRFLEERGIAKDTMIVITSDHGDYLGDHWMGEKDLFHDCSARIPLIVFDPSQEAAATRGTVCDDLVESIDLVPTFLALAGCASTPSTGAFERRLRKHLKTARRHPDEPGLRIDLETRRACRLTS